MVVRYSEIVSEEARGQSRGVGGMSSRTAARVAWSVCALSLLLIALGLAVVFLGYSTPLPTGWHPWTYLAIEAVGVIGSPILGGLIASRRPENPYGWLWLSVGLGWALTSFVQAYAAYSLVVTPGSLPAPRTITVLGQSVGFSMVITIAPFLLLLFPNGRLPSWRWWPLAWSIITVGAVLVVSYPLSIASSEQFVNPIGIDGAVGEVIGVIASGAELLLFGAIVLSTLSLVFRYRGAGRQERQQLKWFAYAGVFVSVYIVLRFFVSELLNTLIGTMVLLGLYAAIAMAILKHHLYDIDIVINRTLVYSALTVVFAGIFVTVDAVTQELLLAFTQQEESWLAVIVSALVIAGLSEPLKRRIQRFVDHRIFRRE
jgi:hypothetical protein